MCYRADNLPIANASLRPTIGWALVDDGGEKGVLKLGLASHRLHDTLTLGPLPTFGGRSDAGPPRAMATTLEPRPVDRPEPVELRPAPTRAAAPSCGAMLLTLGYLLAHSNSTYHGALELACRGCRCAKVSSPFQARLHPFPIVQTDAALHYDPSVRVASHLAVTLSTSFWVAWSAERPCVLHANHRQINYPQGGSHHVREAPSRVRIDSMSLRPATLADMVHLLSHPRDPEHRNFSFSAAACAPPAWDVDCTHPLDPRSRGEAASHAQLGLERELCCVAKGWPSDC